MVEGDFFSIALDQDCDLCCLVTDEPLVSCDLCTSPFPSNATMGFKAICEPVHKAMRGHQQCFTKAHEVFRQSRTPYNPSLLDSPLSDGPGLASPSADSPSSGSPGDSPGGGSPGGGSPGEDSPGGDSPGGDSPGGDSPRGDSPGGGSSLSESLGRCSSVPGSPRLSPLRESRSAGSTPSSPRLHQPSILRSRSMPSSPRQPPRSDGRLPHCLGSPGNLASMENLSMSISIQSFSSLEDCLSRVHSPIMIRISGAEDGRPSNPTPSRAHALRMDDLHFSSAEDLRRPPRQDPSAWQPVSCASYFDLTEYTRGQHNADLHKMEVDSTRPSSRCESLMFDDVSDFDQPRSPSSDLSEQTSEPLCSESNVSYQGGTTDTSPSSFSDNLTIAIDIVPSITEQAPNDSRMSSASDNNMLNDMINSQIITGDSNLKTSDWHGIMGQTCVNKDCLRNNEANLSSEEICDEEVSCIHLLTVSNRREHAPLKEGCSEANVNLESSDSSNSDCSSYTVCDMSLSRESALGDSDPRSLQEMCLSVTDHRDICIQSKEDSFEVVTILQGSQMPEQEVANVKGESDGGCGGGTFTAWDGQSSAQWDTRGSARAGEDQGPPAEHLAQRQQQQQYQQQQQQGDGGDEGQQCLAAVCSSNSNNVAMTCTGLTKDPVPDKISIIDEASASQPSTHAIGHGMDADVQHATKSNTGQMQTRNVAYSADTNSKSTPCKATLQAVCLNTTKPNLIQMNLFNSQALPNTNEPIKSSASLTSLESTFKYKNGPFNNTFPKRPHAKDRRSLNLEHLRHGRDSALKERNPWSTSMCSVASGVWTEPVYTWSPGCRSPRDSFSWASSASPASRPTPHILSDPKGSCSALRRAAVQPEEPDSDSDRDSSSVVSVIELKDPTQEAGDTGDAMTSSSTSASSQASHEGPPVPLRGGDVRRRRQLCNRSMSYTYGAGTDDDGQEEGLRSGRNTPGAASQGLVVAAIASLRRERPHPASSRRRPSSMYNMRHPSVTAAFDFDTNQYLRSKFSLARQSWCSCSQDFLFPRRASRQRLLLDNLREASGATFTLTHSPTASPPQPSPPLHSPQTDSGGVIEDEVIEDEVIEGDTKDPLDLPMVTDPAEDAAQFTLEKLQCRSNEDLVILTEQFFKQIHTVSEELVELLQQRHEMQEQIEMRRIAIEQLMRLQQSDGEALDAR